MSDGIVSGHRFLVGLPVFAFVLVSILDTLVPISRISVRDETASRGAVHGIVLWLWFPSHAGALVCSLLHLNSEHVPALGLFDIAVSVGAMSGMFCAPAAHELMHSSRRFERLLSVSMLTLFTYNHFILTHLHVHHPKVGTPEDPATARKGESLYLFVPRSVVVGYKNAWLRELRRTERMGRRVISLDNRMVVLMIYTLSFYGVAWLFFGLRGVQFIFVQSAIGISILETINYIEHYGLTRRFVKPGIYERVSSMHSWESGQPLSNFLLINLGHHAQHHCDPSRSYRLLRHLENAPQLPTGYFGMFVLALFPPLWRRVMDPRVDAWQRGA